MASSDTEHVVNNAQSMGDSSSIDVHENELSSASAENGSSSAQETSVLPHLAAEQQEPILFDIKATEPSVTIANGHIPVAAHDESSLSNAHTSNGIDSNEDHGHLPSIQEQGESSQTALEASNDITNYPDDIAVTDSNQDFSVGSDTEISRADSTEQTRDSENSHLRSNSVKKPTTFKAVSVTKNFLAKTATVPVIAKTGDKGIAISTLEARSMLIVTPSSLDWCSGAACTEAQTHCQIWQWPQGYSSRTCSGRRRYRWRHGLE